MTDPHNVSLQEMGQGEPVHVIAMATLFAVNNKLSLTQRSVFFCQYMDIKLYQTNWLLASRVNFQTLHNILLNIVNHHVTISSYNYFVRHFCDLKLDSIWSTGEQNFWGSLRFSPGYNLIPTYLSYELICSIYDLRQKCIKSKYSDYNK